MSVMLSLPHTTLSRRTLIADSTQLSILYHCAMFATCLLLLLFATPHTTFTRRTFTADSTRRSHLSFCFVCHNSFALVVVTRDKSGPSLRGGKVSFPPLLSSQSHVLIMSLIEYKPNNNNNNNSIR